MTIIYHEHDADLNELVGKTVGVIGYGALGRPVARNLRDSDITVLVAGNADEVTAAIAEGFDTAPIAQVVQQAEIHMLMLPDELMTQSYMAHVSPNLKRGDTVIFSSAYNLAYGYIEPPPFVDVGLIAPRTLGGVVRERYLGGEPFPSFVAVGQDSTGRAWQTVLGLALALGALRIGGIEVSIEQEAQINLFLQQGVLPAFHNMMVTAAQLMLKNGYPPEALLCDLYLSGRFTDYVQNVADSGLLNTLKLTTTTAKYGTFSRLERFNELKLERLMENVLDEIRSGDFAQEWGREHAVGAPRLQKLVRQQEALDLWELEQQTLDLLGDE